MKVLLAGATGAVGTPLRGQLIEAGHQVLGLTRSESGARQLAAAGVTPVRADAMDRDGLLRALSGMSADAVIHQLTALKKVPMRHGDMAATNALRQTGTANLVAAARELGATRFVTQSIVFGYGYRDHGDRLVTEADPFGVPVGNRLDEHLAAMVAAERQAFEAPGIDGIALRYGGFYGPGAGTDQLVGLLRRRAMPLPRHTGYLPSIYIDDAASAVVAALIQGRGGQAYNIVDDVPTRFGDYIDGLAAAYRVPRPMRVPAGLLRVLPYAHAFLTMSMRVSNAKARAELDWAPSVPSYTDGIRAIVGAAQ